jgi:formylglycine-generating enzyme required for sulfatase activity/DNA-binding winged helix-turn-helix (wHTH) protein/dienelactone hydrolase
MPMNAADGPVDLANEPDFRLGSLEVRPSLREVARYRAVPSPCPSPFGRGDATAESEREILEPRVMQVLVVLASRRGQVVSRDQLIATCWAGRVVGDDAINRCIARLRRLAETHGGFAVETITRVGYRLTSEAAAVPTTVDHTAVPMDKGLTASEDIQPPASAASSPPEAVMPLTESIPKPARPPRRWPLLLAALVIALVAYLGIDRMRSREREQQAHVLAQIAALVDKDQYGAAFVLASPLSRDASVRANPEFDELWRQIVMPMKPLVSQTGATVYFKPYDDPSGEWILAGTTPLTDWVDAPRGALRVKVTKPGFRTGEFVVAVPGPSVETQAPRRYPFDRPSVALELAPEGTLPDDMVFVPRTNIPVYLSGWSTDLLGSDQHDIPAFAIARTEVTNREFKEFIDAGGYETEEYWRDLTFTYHGQTLSSAAARKRFVDTTGRPGPAGWQLSAYPRGQDDLPVGGISWYEAVAYARFRKAMLPTIHHWMRAAFTPYDPMFPTAAAITTQSRFFADAPESALSEHGLGPWGTYHMAGNAREWVWNFAGEDAVALGSGWPEYASNFARIYTVDPMARLPDHGLRLMRTLDDSPVDPALLQPIKLVRDSEFANRAPVSDDAFEAMRFQFTMPHTAPTAVSVNKVEESAQWLAEEVVLSFEGQQPTTLYVVRPKAHKSPLQPIVYSGVGDCCFMKRPNRDVLEQLQTVGFVVDSGRALIIPIWAGGYERYVPAATVAAEATDRERMAALLWQRDLTTTIDYVVSRPDMDAQHIGFFGISRGASFAGAFNLALEPRVRAAVLASGGIWIHNQVHPMIDFINYAPRITIPVLMLSGRYDHLFPYEQQKRTFELLGTPAAQKQQIEYDTGHFTLPPNRVAADVTNWFDRYLGPVR